MIAPPPFGFILVTSDPATSGPRLHAWTLTQTRMEAARWPIYASTRYKKALSVGARLAFYVAGTGPLCGHIVGTATVLRVRIWRAGRSIDPADFQTAPPEVVLELQDVVCLPTPVSFKDRLPALGIGTADPSRWGSLLQGGCRALDEHDWRALLCGSSGQAEIGNLSSRA